MNVNFDTLPFLVCLAFVFFIAYMFFYHKYIYSIVDPLFVWLFTMAFASVLATQVIPDTVDILHFFGCQLSLWIGIFLTYRRSNYTFIMSIDNTISYSFSDKSLLKNFTYILVVIYLISNFIVGYNKGFALLSDSPSESKIANFQNGFGFFRKINWSIGTFVLTSLLYIYIDSKKKIDLLLLSVVVFISSLDGSKSSFLKIAVALGILLYHPAFSGKRVILNNLKKYVPLFIVTSFSIFFSVLLKENDGINDAFLAFIKRLLYSADSVLYYYTPVNISYFENYSFGDYIHRLTNPVLGFFRIEEYREAPGNIMVENLSPPGSIMNVIIGPNAPFFIEGRIYFNYWAAFPYCVFIGYLYSIIRVYFFSLNNVSAFYFIFMASFLQISSAITIDMNLAVTQSFDLAFFVIPLYIVSSLLLTGKLKIRTRLPSCRLPIFRK